MKTKLAARALAGAGLAVAVALAGAGNATAQDKRVKWKMASAFPSTLVHLGPSGVRFAEDVSKMSSGRFEIKFFEPGALVPALECFDPVSKGAIEACWTPDGYHAGKVPALVFFTTVPFGPQIGEFLAWKWHGGGNKLRDEIYEKHGLIEFDGFCIGPETSGWFKREVNSIEELKGLKMRFYGLGAKVMQKLGVSTQLLAGADIYPALERGVIDATEFSMPTIDINLGFHQIAKNNYYPGWHQQVSCSQVLINRKEFFGLSEAYQTMIEISARAQAIYTYAETEYMNPGAMAEMQSKYEVTNRRWPDETLKLYEAKWLEVLAEESAKDAEFKRIADHYLAFRAKYKPWADAQALKATYQE